MRITLHPALYEHMSEVDRAIAFWRNESPKEYEVKDIKVDLLDGIVSALFVDRYNHIYVDYSTDITIRIYVEGDYGCCGGCPPMYTTMKLFLDGTTKTIE